MNRFYDNRSVTDKLKCLINLSKNDHDVFELWEAAFDNNRESLRNFEPGCTDGEQGFPPNFFCSRTQGTKCPTAFCSGSQTSVEQGTPKIWSGSDLVGHRKPPEISGWGFRGGTWSPL